MDGQTNQLSFAEKSHTTLFSDRYLVPIYIGSCYIKMDKTIYLDALQYF